MNWQVYRVYPIDSGWGNLKTVEQVARELGAAEAVAMARDEYQFISWEDPNLADFLSSWQSAKTIAQEYGWEGDFRHDPVVFWIPNNSGSFGYGFVFKQDSYGTTFVISPVPMPWLTPI